MDELEALARFTSARIARLATVRSDHTPHLVPITFAVIEDTVVTAIDHKPKTTQRLQRLRNIEANPAVSVLVDQYSDDWRRLWWVRVDGAAAIHDEGPVRDKAIEALADKYGDYVDRPPAGPVVAVSIERVSSWESIG